MVDTRIAHRTIGNAGHMEIWDNGSTVWMRIRSTDPATNSGAVPIRVYAYGSWGNWFTVAYPSGSPWVTVWSGTVSSNQWVEFAVGDTDTWGFGDGYRPLGASVHRAVVPPAPTPLGVDQITPTSARYRFNGNGDGGSPITSWQAQIASNTAFTTDVQTVTSGGTTTFTDLTPGKRYYFRSRGVNAVGNGAWSAVLDAYVGLPAPTLTNWTQNATEGLVASWTAPSVTTGLTGYRLQLARDAGFTTGVQNIDVGNVLTHTVNGLAGGRVWYLRVAARSAGGINVYSEALNTMLVLNAGDLDGWTRIGTPPTGINYFTPEGVRRGVIGGRQALLLESLASESLTLIGGGIERAITGLEVGKAYRFEATATLTGNPLATDYKLNVVGHDDADPVTVTTSTTSLGEVEFIATTTYVTVQILLAEPVAVEGAHDEVERVAFTGLRLLELVTDYPQRLRETVYESNIANHFDLACNSVGATWYVAKDGITRFHLPGHALPVSVVFSDEIDDTALSYVDIAAAHDTRSMVNTLNVTNYGVDELGALEDNDEFTMIREESISAYGPRPERLDVNLYDEPPYEAALFNRLSDILDAHDQPQLLVSQIRWNAQENLEQARLLEVGQRILVRFNGVEQDSQIVALNHDIQPTRWIITLDLRVVPPASLPTRLLTRADINASFATRADINTTHDTRLDVNRRWDLAGAAG